MCGIFGFISREGEGPDMARLRRIALITQTRGEHAFGLAWLDRQGRIQTFKRPGPAEEHLDALDACRHAAVVLGHCRLATHGSPLDNRNNHPHAAGRGYMVHNGVVHNHLDLAQRYGLCPKTACDSEILGLLMARCPGAIIQRAAWTAGEACGDLAVLGLWRKPARLLVARRGRPLHFGEGRTGFYFASLPEGLPGRVDAVADGSVHVLAHQNGDLHWTGRPIEPTAGTTGPTRLHFNDANTHRRIPVPPDRSAIAKNMQISSDLPCMLARRSV